MRPVDPPDVVEPEEAAREEVRSVGILAVDPPREVDEQLVEDAAEEVDVARAVHCEHLERRPRLHPRAHGRERPPARPEAPPPAPPAGSRATNDHSWPGSPPFGCWNHSRQSSTSWYFAKAGSTCASETQWNARSQAANQGYSHLSGIDMMS